ncbi:MAG: DUF3037 domain-containing protein [Bacteroidota bacterium]|nr:DUF3037 domain-containing protein [Bacteroidota bacterium]
MQENHLFEYAVIRVVPRVEREEFINVGVILYCPSLRFLQSVFVLNKERINAFSCTLDLEELEINLEAFKKICGGEQDGGPIGKLSLVSRFRWLTATRSTILQTSSVHLGLCKDPQQTINKLYKQLVC